MTNDQVVREQLRALLSGGQASMPFDPTVADSPLEAIDTQPPNVSYSPWQLLEHMRITQRNILEFIRNPEHVSPTWPEGYWPPSGAEADEGQWRETIRQFHADMEALQASVADPGTDLCATMPQGEKYTVLREILIIADHNAYHLGEFGILRQLMGTSPEGH